MANETQIKERPILFSTPMVCSILSGDKTQTRRIIKRQPDIDPNTGDWLLKYLDGREEVIPLQQYIDAELSRKSMPKPGDRFWVKETFYAYGYWDTRWSYKKGRPEWYFTDLTQKKGLAYLYHADRTPDYQSIRVKYRVGYWKRPALFMPRAASRILLGINDLWPEKLHDISEDDAIKEGVGSGFCMNAGYPDYTRIKNGICEATYDSAKGSFFSLWVSINGSKSWLDNPFVVAYDFKHIHP